MNELQIEMQMSKMKNLQIEKELELAALETDEEVCFSSDSDHGDEGDVPDFDERLNRIYGGENRPLIRSPTTKFTVDAGQGHEGEEEKEAHQAKPTSDAKGSVYDYHAVKAPKAWYDRNDYGTPATTNNKGWDELFKEVDESLLQQQQRTALYDDPQFKPKVDRTTKPKVRFDGRRDASSDPKKEERTRRPSGSQGPAGSSKKDGKKRSRKHSPTPSNSSHDDDDDQLGRMMKAITTAFSNIQPKSASSTDKFIVRQSHAKDLPLFSGKPEEWTTFIATYKRTTEVCGFTSDENIIRLQRCLRGEALKSVQSLLISPINIPEILETLEMRYGQPRHIIEAMIKQARSIAAVKEERLDTLIEFGTAVRSLTTTIKSLKSQAHLSNPHLVTEMEAKLPAVMRMNWMRLVRDDPIRTSNLEDFSRWLKKEIEIACILCPPKQVEERKQQQPQVRQQNSSQRRVYTTTENSENPGDRKSQLQCYGCDKTGHGISNCSTFRNAPVNERWKTVNKHKLCVCCLRPGHNSTVCRTKRACSERDCKYSHHPLLHKVKEQENPPPATIKTEAESEVDVESDGVGTVTSTSVSNRAFLRIIPVRVKGPKAELQVYALCDEGSTVSLIDQEVAEQLGLEGKVQPLCMQFVGKDTKSLQSSRAVQLKMSGVSMGSKEFTVSGIRTVEGLGLAAQTLSPQKLCAAYNYLNHVPIPTLDKAVPVLLLGADNIHLTVPRKIIEGRNRGPVAIECHLGWGLAGTSSLKGNKDNNVIYHVCDKGDEELHRLVKDSFSTEAFGVKVTQSIGRSREDQRAEELLKATTKKCGEYYEAGSVEAAKKKVMDVIEIHRRGGFAICNFASSSKEVLQSIPAELRSSEIKSLEAASELPMERVLGLLWDPSVDAFTYRLNFRHVKSSIIEGEEVPTKRAVLSLVMSVFDPLGFLSHFTVKAKMLLQDIWKSEIGWDDPIPNSTHSLWKRWLNDLQQIPTVSIPRCYGPEYSSAAVELHIFCDASEKAFACVCYYRIMSSVGITTALVCGKARVAPLKQLSIPRLELQAAVLGVRLGETIRKAHRVPVLSTTFWTDSRNVLCWVRSDSGRFKQFISHRIGEIHEASDPKQWRWVPTKENVADEATRDSSRTDFHPSTRWMNGPKFLTRPEEEWPAEERSATSSSVHDDELEIRPTLTIRVAEPDFSFLPGIERFSRLPRLIRTTAWVFRAVRKWKAKVKKERFEEGELSVAELKKATDQLIKKAQWDSFQEEVTLLQSNQEVEKRSRLFQLSPQLNDRGLLVLKRRLDNLPKDNPAVKYPLILDGKHPFTLLMAMELHRKAGHGGREYLVNELRQNYGILGARSELQTSKQLEGLIVDQCQNSSHSTSSTVSEIIHDLKGNYVVE
jgi:hypothetical protein